MDYKKQGPGGANYFTRIAASIIFALSGGCAPMNTDFIQKKLLTRSLEQISAERQAYEGESHFLQEIQLGTSQERKYVQDVTFEKVPDNVKVTYMVMGNKLSITPYFTEGAEEGIQDISYTIKYTNGTEQKENTKVNFTPEKKGQWEGRRFVEDQEANGNLRRGVYIHKGGKKEGQRFMPTPDMKGPFIEGYHYVRADSDVTKKGHQVDTSQDIQQSIGDFGKVFSRKATYCYYDNAGHLYSSKLKGLPQSIDYLAQTILDTLTNTTEAAAQSVALNDGMSRDIAGTYNAVDCIAQIVKDSFPVGGAGARTIMGTLDLLGDRKLADLPDGASLRVALGDDYYASVRKSGLRTLIDVGTTLGNATILTVKIIENNSGGGNGGGVIVEESPPPTPWGGGGGSGPIP